MEVVSVTQNKLILFESNESIVPLKSTIGLVLVTRGSKKDSAAMEVEKWMVDGEEAPLSMLVRVILFGVPLTTISTAALYIPLDEVHDVNFALLRVICAPSPTVSSNTAPLPLFLAIFENSVWRVLEKTGREDIEGTLAAEATVMRGKEARIIRVNKTPLRVSEPEAEMEMNEEVSGVDEEFQLNSRCEMVVDA